MPADPFQTIMDAHAIPRPDKPLDLSEQVRALDIEHPYVIAMTGRSGSTWLARALQAIPGAGRPQEVFSEEGIGLFADLGGARNFADVLTSIIEKNREGPTFGFKIDPMRLGWLSAYLDVPATFRPPDAAWIDMRRWNVAKQAFSFIRARRSGVWHNYDGTAVQQVSPDEITDREVWQNIHKIIEGEEALDQLYARARITPLRIQYEEVFDSKDQLLLRVLKHIDRKRDWGSIDAGLDGTRKLNSSAHLTREQAFVRAYAAQLNRLSRNRTVAIATKIRQTVHRRLAAAEDPARAGSE